MDALPLHFMAPPELLERRSRRDDEVEDVRALLLDHVDLALGTPQQRWQVADLVALACLGDNHLWQDLQLASRAELRQLLGHWFPSLVEKNVHDMKWKKFFYKQLCERAEIHACRAPSCAVCSDQGHCFGPEDGDPLVVLRRLAAGPATLSPQAGLSATP